jgi:alpha-N-arabinofuranosidase
LPTGDWDKKGAATGFPEAEWFSTIERTLGIKDIISEQLAMIDALETEREFKLYVDEWGMWTDQEEGSANSSLYQQNSLRDAIAAALNLNIFHDNAARIEMTNIAQMVNVLQAMILTDGERMLLTPTYHVFHMYKPFQGATALPVSFASPQYEFDGKSVPALSVSAARTANGELCLALVNADPHDRIDVRTDIETGAARVSGTVLTAEATDAHNTFDKPATVAPRPADIAGGDRLQISLPPKSITVLTIVPARQQ